MKTKLITVARDGISPSRTTNKNKSLAKSSIVGLDYRRWHSDIRAIHLHNSETASQKRRRNAMKRIDIDRDLELRSV